MNAEEKTTELQPVPPRFLSREFHVRFLPGLLRARLRSNRRDKRGVSFTSNLEMMVTLAICAVLAVIGIPFALTQGSILGWVLTVVGLGGICVLFIQSVGSQWGSRPTYDDFLVGIFFFFVSLGVFVGIPVGMEYHSALAGVITSTVGFLGGYALGVAAGLQLQRMGWIAVTANMVAGFCAIILVATVLVMLLFYVFG
jgi:hypothetical protein